MLKASIISNQIYRNTFTDGLGPRLCMSVHFHWSVKIVFVSNLWSVDYYPISIDHDGLLTVTLFPVSYNARTTYGIVLTENSGP